MSRDTRMRNDDLALCLHRVPKKTCDYIFYHNFNSKCPISIIWHYPTLAPGGGWLFFALKYGLSVFVRQLCV